jgi:hypothetical protein
MSGDDKSPFADEIEQRAVVLAIGMLTAIAGPRAAKQRLEELVSATAENVATLAESTAAIAALDEKQALFAKADAALSQRVVEFQAWADSTKASLVSREQVVVQNELSGEERLRTLVDRESDLARRMQSHEQRVAALKQSLT